ncbi:MAG: hypothetical protein ACLRSW_13985 [Christensenellaceae bacterium]
MIKLFPVLKDYLWGGYKLKGLFGRDNGGKENQRGWKSPFIPTVRAVVKTADFFPNTSRKIPLPWIRRFCFSMLIKYIDA